MKEKQAQSFPGYVVPSLPIPKTNLTILQKRKRHETSQRIHKTRRRRSLRRVLTSREAQGKESIDNRWRVRLTPLPMPITSLICLSHSSGIGRAIAIMYAKEGADVSIVYLPEEADDAEDTKKQVVKEGKSCLLIAGNLMDNQVCREAIQKHVRE